MAPGANAIQRLVCLWSTLRLCTALDVQIWQHRVHSCSFNRHIKKTTLCKDSKTAVTCSRSSHPFSDHQRNERKHMEILLFVTSTTAQTDTEHGDNDAHQSPVSRIRTCTKCPQKQISPTAGESRLVPEGWAYTFKRAVQTTCRATQWYRGKINRGRGFRSFTFFFCSIFPNPTIISQAFRLLLLLHSSAISPSCVLSW